MIMAKAEGLYTVKVLENDVVVQEVEGKNLLTTQGVNALWDIMFDGSTGLDPWFLGLIDSVPTPALQITDTLATTPGWNELVPGVDYAGTRKAWVAVSSVNRTKTSANNVVFDILTTKTLYGAFLASVSSGTSGILMSEGAFGTPISVTAANTIQLTYSIQML